MKSESRDSAEAKRPAVMAVPIHQPSRLVGELSHSEEERADLVGELVAVRLTLERTRASAAEGEARASRVDVELLEAVRQKEASRSREQQLQGALEEARGDAEGLRERLAAEEKRVAAAERAVEEGEEERKRLRHELEEAGLQAKRAQVRHTLPTLSDGSPSVCHAVLTSPTATPSSFLLPLC